MLYFSQDNDVKQAKETISHETGHDVFFRLDSDKQTKWDEISGHLTLEYNFVNGDMHGIQRKWDHNGTIQSEYNYKNGDKHGIQREWDNSGQLLVEENYVNGKLTK